MADSNENPTNEDASNSSLEGEGNKNGEFEAWDPERAKADMSKKNAENKSLRERLKVAEEKAAQLDAVKQAEEDAKKSEAEKFAELSAANQKLQREIWARDVREDLKLTPAQMKYITGDSLEELKANAEAFKKDVLGKTDDDEEEFELTEDELEAAFSPLKGNRRASTSVSRARATGDGAGDSSNFDANKLAQDIMRDPWA
jgi:hypothetical protein